MSDATALVTGRMRFVQHRLPAMQSGEYRLSFRHDVTITGDRPGRDAFGDAVQFAVAGERFTLVPSEVDSVFPARGATGEFSNVLPHIVLTRRTLPWERSSENGPSETGNQQLDVPSWLALLVFDQGDPQPTTKTGTLQDLLTKPAGVTAYPGLELEYGEAATDPCNLIDVDGGLFVRIAPTLEDLKLVAHVRSVNTSRKPGQADSAPDATRDYAVIMANRLPLKGHRSLACLVSVECLEDYLPRAGGQSPVTTATTLRMACLASWSFNCLEERETFATVIESISKRPDGVGPLRFPSDPGASGPVGAALASGYVGLTHGLRDGGKTASWYRGPFAPCAVGGSLVPVPLSSADAALSYDPSTGLLDASYAAAWQLGRLLGLQNRDYCGQLLDWKHALKRDALAGLEHAFLASKIASDVTEAAVSPLAAAVRSVVKTGVAALTGAPVPGAAVKKTVGAVRPGGAALAAALVDSDTLQGALHTAPAIPTAVQSWLMRLRRLQGVPFPYLVPDERELPPESIRFFHVDANWLDALVDGAFGLGNLTMGDAAVHAAYIGSVGAPVGAAPGGHPVTGFLLRSRAVKEWPGLEAEASAAGVALEFLRYERLADDVLLGLVNEVPDTVVLHEPPEGLHFGVDVPDDASLDPAGFVKQLRDLATAAPMAQSVPLQGSYRADGTVIELATLSAAVSKAMDGALITAAEFGMVMVEGVDRVTFNWTMETAL
jgi:hypothetical protein